MHHCIGIAFNFIRFIYRSIAIPKPLTTLELNMYILIKDPDTDNPEIIRDSVGLLQWFETEEKAHQYALDHDFKEYEIFKLSQDSNTD